MPEAVAAAIPSPLMSLEVTLAGKETAKVVLDITTTKPTLSRIPVAHHLSPGVDDGARQGTVAALVIRAVTLHRGGLNCCGFIPPDGYKTPAGD
jgi:hypothetical protein